MATEFKSKVEITAQDGVSKVMESIANRAGTMARVVHDRTKFLMNDMANSIGKKMETIANNTKGLWGQSGVMGALGGALVTGGTIEAMSSLAERTEQLHIAAIGLGLSTKDMQHWSYAAKMAGLDADMMTRGVAKMNQTIFEVAHGGAKAQADLFKQMGVSVRDAKGNTRGITDVAMDAAQRFKEHVDRIAKLQAGGQGALANTLQVETDNAAQSLFGMKAREIAAMMAQGKEGIQKAFAGADALGGMLSDEQFEKMERYQGAMVKLDFAKQGLFAGLFADKIALLGDKASGLADKLGAFQKANPQILKFASSTLIAVAGLATVATSARLAHMALTFMAGGAESVVTALRMVTVASPWLLAIAAGAALIYANWDKIQPVVQRVWDSLKLVWDTIQPLLSAFASGVWDTFKETFSQLWDVAKGLWDTFAQLFSAFGGVSGQASDSADQFERAARVAEVLRGILDGLKLTAELATIPFRLLATSLEAIADKIQSVMAATKSGGILAGILKVFDLKENVQLLAKRGQQNFAGVGGKLAQIAKDADDKSKVVTPEQIKQRAELAKKAEEARKSAGGAPGAARPAAPAARQRAEEMPSKPVSVRLDGPVQAQLDTKGKLSIDLRIAADQGLKVGQSGVDRSGAPNIVGDVAVMPVMP
jgi:hypothetical protein